MKKIFLIILLSSCSVLVQAQLTTKQTAQQLPVNFIKNSYLLKTNWDQWGTYAKYSPDNQVLGCWSTALAQILYYHKSKPFGNVAYQCSKGYQIKDTLNKHEIDFNNFEPAINENTSARAADAVAMYSYFTAEVVRKDFGTGKYLELVNPAPQIEQHFYCKADFYICITGEPPFSPSQMDAIVKNEQIHHLIKEDSVRLIIKKELKRKNPVYFHFGNFTTYGHSTVIDGFKEQNGIFYVHINYGSSGFRTGWYDLFKPLDMADDLRLRVFVTIHSLNKPVS